MESGEQIDNNVHELDLIRSHSLSCIASKTEELCLRLYSENRTLRELKRSLCEEIDVLRKENESLSYENETLKRETDEFRVQRNEFRSENEVLRAALTEKENLFKSFAKQILKDNSFNIPHHVVNSLPCFNHTHIPYGESLPVSLDHCSANDSYSNLKDLRLAQSKEQNTIQSQTSSMSNNTSASDTYVTACSRPSIPAAQNAIRSLSQNLPSTSQTNHVNGVNDSSNSSFSTDDRSNIMLKPARVTLNRQIDVDMAFIDNPASFWLHLNYDSVNNYIHHIQVTQNKLLKTNDYKLTCKDIYVGMYCVAIYSLDGDWYRAQVIAINYEPTDQKELFETVKVIYVDWGNIETVHISKITRLTSDLTKRKQAIKCYLQGIQLEDKNWPKEVIDEFKRIVSGQKLCAVLNKADNEKNSVIEPFQHIYPVDLIIITQNGIENVVESLFAKRLYLFNPKPDNDQTVNISDLSNDLSTFNRENEMTNNDRQNIVNETKISNTNNSSQSNTNNLYLNFNGDCSKQHNNSDKSDSTIVNKEVTANLNSFEITTEKLSTNSKNLSSVTIGAINNTNNNSNSDLFQIPPPIIPTSESLTVQASYIHSPSEFFVHIHGNEGLEVGIAHLDDLIENLNAHYSQSANQLYVSDISRVTINSFWVCLYREDDTYYRVRVIGLNGERVEISYIDYGNTEFVSFKELIPLTRRFASYPALCVKCSLSGISPLSDKGWPTEATENFIRLTGVYDKFLTAFIGFRPEISDFNSKLEVLLWTSGESLNDILINSILVAERLAHTDNMEWFNEVERVRREKTPPEMSKLIKGPINSGTNVNNSSTNNKVIVLPELIQEEDELDDDYLDWDPKAEDYYSARNNYAVDVNDPGTATMGFRPKDVKSCRFFGTAKGCFSGNHCQFLHIPPEKRFAIEDTEEEQFNISGLDLEVGAYYIFKVTGIQSPNSFYGILPFGDEPIRDENQLKQVLCGESSAEIEYIFAKDLYAELKYSKLRNDTNPDIFHADGSLVVAKDDKSGIYFRARVLNFDDQTNKYKLFNIDSGFIILVSRSSVFKLEKYFCELPALAVHCSFKGIEPYSSGPLNANWSHQAIESFTDWALNKLFCVHILSTEYENKVEVDLVQYIGDERESISEKLIHHKFAQHFDNFRDDEIYPPSDID